MCVPKATMLKVLIDLKTGDACKTENKILDSNINILTEVIKTKDTIITDLKTNIQDHETKFANISKLEQQHKKNITKLQRQIKVWKYVAVIAKLVAIVAFIK